MIPKIDYKSAYFIKFFKCIIIFRNKDNNDYNKRDSVLFTIFPIYYFLHVSKATHYKKDI